MSERWRNADETSSRAPEQERAPVQPRAGAAASPGAPPSGAEATEPGRSAGTAGAEEVAVVVIGRNEAPRLEASLRSALLASDRVVYVDSASSDGSPRLAEDVGVDVVRIDPQSPLSAARARNEGFEHATRRWPWTRFVQFVDGDCELHPEWVARAAALLVEDPSVGIACGRLRERQREASLYSRLCDMEFNREPGDVASCGGIFLVRATSFRDAGGFDPSVVAGEEPEMCLRLRRSGSRVVRLDAEMARHDASMTRFGEWWRRAVRSGLAYAQATALHGRAPERLGVRESVGIVGWALVLPAAAAAAAACTHGLGLLLLVLYPVQVARIALARRRPGESRADAWLYGAACVVAKWPQLTGLAKFWAASAGGRSMRVVDVRRAPAPPVGTAGRSGSGA